MAEAFRLNLNEQERKVFSQNGEDGIIACLASGLRQNTQRFVEIGTSDGAENNTFHLLQGGWSGLGIDASEPSLQRYRDRIRGTPLEKRIALVNCKVHRRNCLGALGDWLHDAPDFFSLDIDGIDYYVAEKLMAEGFRPAIICCEYNSFLGDRPLTVVYDEEIARYRYDPARGLYFGASVAAWRHLFGGYGYRFLGVESAGVNAFFARSDAVAPAWLDSLHALGHAHNRVFVKKYGMSGDALSRELLARPHLQFVDVTVGGPARNAGASRPAAS